MSPNRYGRGGAVSRTMMLLLVVCAVAAGVMLLVFHRGERRALLRMPASDRLALYEKTYAAFRELCDGSPPAQPLRARCREQASLLRQFPECDPACVELVTFYVPGPSR